MRMRTQKRKTLLLHSARLHTVAICVLTNVIPPPPPLTFVYFCKGAVAGDAIAAAVPLGRILAAHRTDSNRSAARRFCLNGDTFVYRRGNANLRTSTDFTLLCRT